MAQDNQNNSALVIIAIIGVIGSVIAAIITVTGNYNVEKMRQQAELTRIALESTTEAQAEATPKLITITLTNHHCLAQDYYVDGVKVVSSLVPNAKVQFNVAPGDHQVLSCDPGTNSCGDAAQMTWTSSTISEIVAAPTCPITIKVTNQHCEAMDYYVDEKLMVSSIEPNAEVQFDASPGEHQVKVCDPGTDSCGDPVTLTWSVSTTTEILRSPTCPITITVTNNHCRVLDFYVDDQLMLSSIQPGSVQQLNVIPGEHKVLLCNSNTKECGVTDEVNWTTPATYTISPASDCPQ